MTDAIFYGMFAIATVLLLRYWRKMNPRYQVTANAAMIRRIAAKPNAYAVEMAAVDAALAAYTKPKTAISARITECVLHGLPLVIVTLPLVGFFLLSRHFLLAGAVAFLAWIPLYALAERLRTRVIYPRLLQRKYLLQKTGDEDPYGTFGITSGVLSQGDRAVGRQGGNPVGAGKICRSVGRNQKSAAVRPGQYEIGFVGNIASTPRPRHGEGEKSIGSGPAHGIE